MSVVECQECCLILNPDHARGLVREQDGRWRAIYWNPLYITGHGERPAGAEGPFCVGCAIKAVES